MGLDTLTFSCAGKSQLKQIHLGDRLRCPLYLLHTDACLLKGFLQQLLGDAFHSQLSLLGGVLLAFFFAVQIRDIDIQDVYKRQPYTPSRFPRWWAP